MWLRESDESEREENLARSEGVGVWGSEEIPEQEGCDGRSAYAGNVWMVFVGGNEG